MSQYLKINKLKVKAKFNDKKKSQSLEMKKLEVKI